MESHTEYNEVENKNGEKLLLNKANVVFEKMKTDKTLARLVKKNEITHFSNCVHQLGFQEVNIFFLNKMTT